MFGYQSLLRGSDAPDALFGDYNYDYLDTRYGSTGRSPTQSSDAVSGLMLRDRGRSPSAYGIEHPQFVDGGTYGQHWGGTSGAVDIFGQRGSPIRAPGPGTVTTTTRNGPGGPIHAAILRLDSGPSLLFGHVEPNIRQGRVRSGDTFALLGNSGLAGLGNEAPHVHFAVSRSGQFGGIAGLDGDTPTLPFLESIGFKGKRVGQTPGPQELQMGLGGQMLGRGSGGSPYGNMGGGAALNGGGFGYGGGAALGMGGLGGLYGQQGGLPGMAMGGLPGMGMPGMMPGMGMGGPGGGFGGGMAPPFLGPMGPSLGGPMAGGGMGLPPLGPPPMMGGMGMGGPMGMMRPPMPPMLPPMMGGGGMGGGMGGMFPRFPGF